MYVCVLVGTSGGTDLQEHVAWRMFGRIPRSREHASL